MYFDKRCQIIYIVKFTLLITPTHYIPSYANAFLYTIKKACNEYTISTLSSLKKVFITESARNKVKYHSSHTHSTDSCLQRWLLISPRGPSGHRGDSKDWSRLWRRRKEWSGAPRPGPPDGGPSLPSGKLQLNLFL